MEYRLKTMTLGEILETSFSLLTKNFVSFCTIGGMWVLILIPLALIGMGALFGFTMDPQAAQQQLFGLVTHPMRLAFVMGVTGLLLMMAQFLSTSALTYAVAKKYLGEEVTFSQSYHVAFGRLLPLFLTSLIAGLMVVVGCAFFVIPGIFVIVSLCIVAPIVILENKSGIEAIQRSWYLVRGNRWKILGIFLILAVSQWIPNLVIEFLPIPLVKGLLKVALMVAVTAIGQIACTLIYFHTRCEKEGFDLQRLADVAR